jgi:His/Glu/Gln/Arg/opine family amino acid ABC transporter permease subunit
MNDLLFYLPALGSGLLITLVLMLTSMSIGFMLALSMTVASLSEMMWLKKFIASLIFFIRGTPLLVQLYLIYYGMGQFEWLRASLLWPLLRQPMTCAIIALSLNTACYTTVLMQGAIASVPKNEIAACHAIGMSTWQALRYIIFPRALRLMLPAYSNEVLFLLKGTSLASTITLLDLMGITQQLIAETYAVAQWYMVAALIYLLLNALITTVFSLFIRLLSKPKIMRQGR